MSAVEYNVTNNDTVPIANMTNEDDLAAMTLSESTNNSISLLGNYSTTAPSISPAPSTNTPSSSPTSSPSSVTPPPTYSALPIQPINIIVLTDVHSWVMGHGDHAPTALGDVDYGHVLSFYQQFKETVLNHDLGTDSFSTTSNTPDLYLVNNGDYLHGTLLGDDPGRSLTGILGKMPYDVVTVGDHELTNSDSLGVLREPGGLFDEWGDRLITSNVRITTEDSSSSSSSSNSWKKKKDDASLLAPLGRNYKLLHGNQGTVLVLGFLYDMGHHDNQKATTDLTVQKVEDALKQPWFTSLFVETTFDSTGKEVLRPLQQFQFDVILAMAHMDVEDELIALLHSTIRGYVGDSMTIQFVTGHTHKRAYVELDDYASSFEAGRYLETIGYVSFHPGVAGSSEHVFIDADRMSLGQSLGTSAVVEEEANEDTADDYYPRWMTEDGMELSRYIRRTVEHAGADEILGCSNERYRADGRMDEADSLSRLYLERVLPASSYVRHASRSGGTHHHNSHNDKKKEEGQGQEHNVFVQYLEWSSGTAVGYDLFPGAVTVNDIYGVVPTDDVIVKLGHSIRGGAILDIVDQMNNNTAGDTIVGVAVESSSSSNPQSSQEALIPPYGIQNETMYTLHTLSRHAVTMQSAMVQLDVPAVVASSSSIKNQQSMRSLWMEFVQREWPYDGNHCQCLQDEDGCGSSRSNNTDYIVVAPPAANGGESGGNIGSSSEFGEGETTTATAPTAHGGKSKHTSHNSPPSNHTHHGQSKGGHLGDFNKSRNPGASNMPVFWVTIATVAIIVFVVFRRPRQNGGSQSTAVRRSEMPSDLELRESAAPGSYGAAAGGGGYGAPAVPRRGTYV